MLRGGVVRPRQRRARLRRRPARERPRPALLPPGRRRAPPPRPARRAPSARSARRAARALVPRAGNHDLLVAGELAPHAARPTPSRPATACSSGPPVAARPREASAATARSTSTRCSRRRCPATTAPVPADPARRLADARRRPWRALRAAAGTAAGSRCATAFDLGPRVRGIVLDTVRPQRRARAASSPPREVTWLAPSCARRGRPLGVRLLPPAARPHSPAARRTGAARRRPARRRHRRRRHAPQPHRAARHRGGRLLADHDGALADYPQQARMLRVRETAGGGAVLETWMLDTARARSPPRRARSPSSTPRAAGRTTSRARGSTATSGCTVWPPRR